MMRFCQQCSKLQPIEDFQGERRSCQQALERHASRRQSRQNHRVTRSPSPQPQARPARRPRLEQPSQQESAAPQQGRQQQQSQQQQQQSQQQQQQRQQQLRLPATADLAPSPSADPEPGHVWPAELLQLAQQEQERQQRQGQQQQQLGGGLKAGSLSLVVGHPTERLEITISLEPWVNMQPAPCSDGPSAGEPTLSAAEVREAWNESLASLPAVHSSPFQKAAAAAAPATTRCSSLSATTVAANATTMLPIPMPRGGAAALVPAGSGNHSPAFASHAAAVTVEAPVYAPLAVSPRDGHPIELTGSNSLRLMSRQLSTVADLGLQVQPRAPAPAAMLQPFGFTRQPPTVSAPLAAGQPAGTLGPRGSSNWGSW
ncbi:hypothetical protein COHA_009942 [Chlorella ohadii]|uniref:SBP-type domain-containing protein n=1 Tax=Chlorella ohadii TaxID=2649997 RepID=A0AAD5DIL8_9CHLO|nr:hypothetical protein COHA_009942 [Chlorella ohadii]